MQLQDLSGQTFGRLTVLSRGETVSGRTMWNCRCSCGSDWVIVNSHKLKTGHTQSCGCLQRERTGNATRTHGKTESPEYEIWCGMVKRCTNPNTKHYHRYGGRGISVCDRWLHSFENFYDDMGSRPSPRHSLDRRDNSGGYCPENCRWATGSEQARNTRGNRLIILNGEQHCLADWLDRKGMEHHTYKARRRIGWSEQMALETPVRSYVRKLADFGEVELLGEE